MNLLLLEDPDDVDDENRRSMEPTRLVETGGDARSISASLRVLTELSDGFNGNNVVPTVCIEQALRILATCVSLQS